MDFFSFGLFIVALPIFELYISGIILLCALFLLCVTSFAQYYVCEMCPCHSMWL